MFVGPSVEVVDDSEGFVGFDLKLVDELVDAASCAELALLGPFRGA